MQLTRAADYAVRVSMQLAMLPPGGRASRAQLARWAEAPASFIAKILQHLVAGSIVRSQAGRRGGFVLARPAPEISVLDIVQAIDGPLMLNTCLPPQCDCTRAPWCPAHPVWTEAQAALSAVLAAATLAKLVEAHHAKAAAVAAAGETMPAIFHIPTPA